MSASIVSHIENVNILRLADTTTFPPLASV
eukprot:SAG31_NODE_27611_length_423_cov_0.793210_2_plen_29_part_01